MATKRKQATNITSYSSPTPKRRDPEEHFISADKNMQLSHGSIGQETRPPRPRPETEAAESEACLPGRLEIDPQSNLDIADFATTPFLSVLSDQVKYRVIKERKPSLHDSIPSKTYTGSVLPGM